MLALAGGCGLKYVHSPFLVTRPKGVTFPYSTTCTGREAPQGTNEASLVTASLCGHEVHVLGSSQRGEASVCRAS